MEEIIQKMKALESKFEKMEEEIEALKKETEENQSVFKKLRKTNECTSCNKFFATKNSLR